MPEPRRRTISQRSEVIYDVHNFGVMLDTREIFLNSDLDYDYEEAMLDHRSANTFIRNLQILNSLNHTPILVHQITCGGDWNYGIAIYDAIKNSCQDPQLSNITVLAYAHARSMSSVIPQAATWRVMMPNADFLIHYGTLGVEGNYTSVVSEVDWAKKQLEVMLDIYVDRCKDGEFFKKNNMDERATRKWLKDKIDSKQEFYTTAQESVYMGFMDGVMGDEDFETMQKLRDE